MELRSTATIAFFLLFLAPVAVSDIGKPVAKRAIASRDVTDKHDSKLIEGSGGPPSRGRNTATADIEWEASGVGPDDEDGDGSEDEIEGSGGRGPSGSIVKAPPLAARTTTTTALPPPPVDDEEVRELGRRPILDSDVAIEEETTTTSRTTVPSRSVPSTSTPRFPPPTVFEDEKHAPFNALFKPGILAAVIGGVVVGILASILLVMFVVYRMRKKDEGSYALDEPKQPPHYSYAYQKAPAKEFYA